MIRYNSLTITGSGQYGVVFMPELNEVSINDYIVRRLARGVNEHDLIFEICRKNQLNWNEAHSLVEKIKAENADAITSRQMPVKSLLAVAALIMGLLLVIVNALLLAEMLSLVSGYVSGNPVDPGAFSTLPGANISLAQMFMQESQYAIPFAAGLLINGLAMIFGSLLGMRETWIWLVEKISTVIWK